MQFLLLVLLFAVLPSAASAQPTDAVHRSVLANGLTLIVAENHSTPRVAVHLWYRVGSNNDPKDRSGFAHLFEHLMYRGSENAAGDYWNDMRRIGATGTNAGTAPDRTTYFQTVPSGALEYALWREADRMAALAPSLSQETLNSERAVVQNELRQNRAGPAGSVWTRVAAATYPGHPYARDTLGEIADLNAATVDELRAFHRRYYVPANAILVLAGDVDPTRATELVNRHFGSIPAGERISGPVAWAAPLPSPRRDVVADAVSVPRIFRIWNIPGYGTPAAIDLGLFADALQQRLEAEAGTSVAPVAAGSAYIVEQALGSQFIVDVTLTKDADLGGAEAWLTEQMETLARGALDEQIEGVAAKRRAALLARMERIGGFGGRADTLASSEGFLGDPMAWQRRLTRYASPESGAVTAAAKRWLDANHYTLAFVPASQPSNTAGQRPLVPPPITATAPFKAPDAVESRSVSGRRLAMISRPGQLAHLALILPGAERGDDRAGARSVALTALLEQPVSEGTVRQSLDRLGATVTVEEHPQAALILLRVPVDTFQRAGSILIKALRPGSLKDAVVVTAKSKIGERVFASRRNVLTLPQILLPTLYGRRAPDSETLNRVQLSDIEAMRACWRGGDLHAIYVGPDPHQSLPSLASALDALPQSNGATCAPNGTEIVRPGTVSTPMSGDQAMVLAALPLPPADTPEAAGLETALAILGANTTGRLDRILRVERGWTYGIAMTVSQNQGSRLLTLEVPVSATNVRETQAIVERELRRLGEESVTDEELRTATASIAAEKAARWETGSGAAVAIAHQTIGGTRSSDAPPTVDEVRASARQFLSREPSWILAGGN
ncbi:M16 family metallopeptidase [Sphingomonas mucosissima]|uniref:Protease 3 n=1 Tax=Sphingomonas mucosissima TaxID=370959 RepID=A0A245ZDZ7_9SPHN|nr:insulinase family protein [Sphingomonas mucosissima]OWK27957.1 protease 3 precursor [Sphingomonas mucosissima]